MFADIFFIIFLIDHRYRIHIHFIFDMYAKLRPVVLF